MDQGGCLKDDEHLHVYLRNAGRIARLLERVGILWPLLVRTVPRIANSPCSNTDDDTDDTDDADDTDEGGDDGDSDDGDSDDGDSDGDGGGGGCCCCCCCCCWWWWW